MSQNPLIELFFSQLQHFYLPTTRTDAQMFTNDVIALLVTW